MPSTAASTHPANKNRELAARNLRIQANKMVEKSNKQLDFSEKR